MVRLCTDHLQVLPAAFRSSESSEDGGVGARAGRLEGGFDLSSVALKSKIQCTGELRAGHASGSTGCSSSSEATRDLA